MLSNKAIASLLGAVVVAVVLAACGSSGSGSSTSAGSGSGLETGGYKSPLTESLTGGKKGGTLQVLQETEFEHLDPGESYYNLDYPVVFATQRPLYSYKPNQSEENTPDMASGPAEISSDGKTVTVHLKEGVHFSPPVNREVTASDVAYGIERGANPTVANGYTQAYFASIEGMPNGERRSGQGDRNPRQAHDRLSPDRTEGPARGRSVGAAPRRRRCLRNTPKSTTSTNPPTTPTTRWRRVRT